MRKNWILKIQPLSLASGKTRIKTVLETRLFEIEKSGSEIFYSANNICSLNGDIEVRTFRGVGLVDARVTSHFELLNTKIEKVSPKLIWLLLSVTAVGVS